MSREQSRQHALDRLRATDVSLEARVTLSSLCPGRARATPLASLAEQLLPRNAPLEVAAAFAGSLSDIGEAIQRNFPGNLFWDLDFLAAWLLRIDGNAEPAERAHAMERAARAIVSLHNLFSHASRIQFRYAHDFLYGFDWAKWVARAPEARAHVEPFGLEFVHGMQQRGAEILALIARDDDKYPNINPGSDRNPFRFARDPRAEDLLHRDLAARGSLPLAAWSVAAEPVWDRPYAELRNERARALGLVEEPPPSGVAEQGERPGELS
jgi:hypothetical protein